MAHGWAMLAYLARGQDLVHSKLRYDDGRVTILIFQSLHQHTNVHQDSVKEKATRDHTQCIHRPIAASTCLCAGQGIRVESSGRSGIMEADSDFAVITGLIKDLLERHLSTAVTDLIDQMFREMKRLEQDANRGLPDEQVDECAISLWNWGVTKRVEESITEHERAIVRHAACILGIWCEGTEPSEGVVRRNILMAMKTGKGWIDVGEHDLASGFLDVALNKLEMLYAMLAQRSSEEADMNMHKTYVEKDLFKVLTYQAEVAFALKDFEMASQSIQRCKDMLMRQPKEAGYLAVLCYNFGVDTYEEKIYEQSSFWLSQSYEIANADKRYSPGHEMQAKVLRLLATVYMEWDCKFYQDKALTAIRMANEVHVHPAGLFLKMKILLQSSQPDEIIGIAVTEMLNHELGLDIYLNTAKLLLEHRRDFLAFDLLKMVCKHFENSPDVGKAVILHIELLLQRGKEQLARQKTEDLITGHHIGKKLSIETLNLLHLILWDCAAKSFEAKNYRESLEWYNYSLSFYAVDQFDPNFAKLQRNRASCFLNLHEFDKAKEVILEAACADRENIFTQFSLYKLAMLENNILEATKAISAMGNMAAQSRSKGLLMQESCSDADLFTMAAQIALEKGYTDVALKALECIVEQDHNTEQVFLSLRTNDGELILSYLNTAHKKLTESLNEGVLSHDKVSSDAHWFRKIAWNVAVQAEDSPKVMRDAFILSYQLSLFCNCDKSILVAQKSCLLMATAVNLEIARKNTDYSEQVQILTKSLNYIQLCQEIWRALQSSGDFSQDPTEVLLLLYEFEIRAKLNDPRLETVLEKVWELPRLDIKTLETIAHLSMETPSYYPSICKRALQGALTLHKKQDPLDVSMLSKCLHSLIKLSLPEGAVEVETCVQEEVWKYFQDALSIITSCDDYPEIELLWLMTRAWNTGIFQYSVKRYTDAERWCALAMRLLNHLGTLKSSYENQMVGLYSEILEQVDKAKRALPNEE
uniref:Protein ZIP4 homolog n=1 Tax=Leptobrachium leishanense TaxID=445787 RepID=A0A8C5Q413_9ANUR